MALRSELIELTDGFEKRMKFIQIIRCLLEYKYPDAIRAMFPDKQILDNLVVAVLVFINDRTLGSEQDCGLSDIERFLEDFSVVLPAGCAIDSGKLAEHIVVEVLQNGGVLPEYLTYNSAVQAFQLMPIRLINEKKGTYRLTDDAFDFLYRSKEIESEIDFSVTRFRMKEYMKRDNYSEVLQASRELVSRIRNMKQSMENFLLRCREDISRITVDQYDAVIGRIRTLLDNEYQELTDIRNSAGERAQKLLEAQQSGVGGEETRQQRRALTEIIDNIAHTIEEQRSLINRKTSLSEEYRQLLRDNFTISRYRRMSFEKDLMVPLRQMGDELGDAAKVLLFMLTKPQLEHRFSVENFYAPQTKINDAQEKEGLDISAEEGEQARIIARRDARFQRICTAFFGFAAARTDFTAEELVESLSVANLFEFCEENALPTFLLTLYGMQTLDIAGWKASERMAVEPMGELELSWCLNEMPPENLEMKAVRLTGSGDTFRFSVKKEDVERSVCMTNFRVEVER